MRKFGNILLFVLAFGVAGYALVAYSLIPLGALVHPDMKAVFLEYRVGILTHVFASAMALVLGPLQFSTMLRRERPRLHRWMGRIYLAVGVLAGGLAGLTMAQHAFGGTIARLGFSLLAIGWLLSGLCAFMSIRRGAVEAHRKWMIRNFSLTFAAVTLRLYLPASMVAGISFEQAYPFIAWLCWVPNILVAEWLFNNRPRSLSDQPHTPVAWK
jgi:uncharacterized membrane protein